MNLTMHGIKVLLWMALTVYCIQFQAGAAENHVLKAVIIPKIVGIDYYDAVKQGIDEADRQLPELEIQWTGPTQDRVEQQIRIIEDLIPERPDLIAVAANDPVRIVPVLQKAHKAGIRIMSWDGDTNFREFFVNHVEYEDFGRNILESMAEQTGPRADIAIVTTTFTAPNQVRWIQAMKRYRREKYPDITILDIRPATESRERSYRIGRQYLNEFKSLDGIIALGVPNVSGVARAVEDAGMSGKIAVAGNSTPNLARDFLKRGTMKKAVLWNAPDHGYLTVYCALNLLKGNLIPGKPFDAGRLGRYTPRADALNMQVALPVMVFTKENVDRHHF